MENDMNKIPGMETNNEEQKIDTNRILGALDFGEIPKILSKEDVEKLIGGKIRFISQPDYAPIDAEASWYCEVTGVRSHENRLETKALEFDRPRISADESELAEILKERGYVLTHVGRSGFASRNRYVISKANHQTRTLKAPLIMECYMDKENAEKFGVKVEESSQCLYTIWTGEYQEKEIILESEIQEAKDAIQKAKEELKQRKKKKMIEYIESRKNGNISIVEVGGGPEDFHYSDIPENYVIIAEKRSGCTQNHRRNMTHTYTALLIDQNDFVGKAFMKIKVPDAYKGMVIGSGGSNIRSLCEKLKCRIIIE